MRVAGLAVAGMAALLLVFADDLLLAARADANTSAGKRLRHELPDGSLALLNTDGALAVDYEGQQRQVRLLKGEAFFEVRPRADAPFRVEAGGARVEEVGTAFAVRDTGGPVTVTVAEGTVVVRPTQRPEADIGPPARVEAPHGLAIDDRGEAVSARTVDVDRSLAWRGGRIMFEATPFAEAIAELDRYYPGRILLLGRAREATPVSGVIHADQLLPGIRAMAEAQGLTATELPGGLALILR